MNLFTDKELKLMESWKKLSLKKLKEKKRECKDAIFSLNFPSDSSRSFPSCRPSFSEINKEDQRLNYALNKIRKFISDKENKSATKIKSKKSLYQHGSLKEDLKHIEAEIIVMKSVSKDKKKRNLDNSYFEDKVKDLQKQKRNLLK